MLCISAFNIYIFANFLVNIDFLFVLAQITQVKHISKFCLVDLPVSHHSQRQRINGEIGAKKWHFRTELFLIKTARELIEKTWNVAYAF